MKNIDKPGNGRKEARENSALRQSVAVKPPKPPRIEYDPEYISYVKNGDSAAVFITRDVADAVPTGGRWVDVIDVDGRQRADRRWDFRAFTVELFPRKEQPVYPQGISEDDRKYITWKTAHDDIAKQRRSGVRGVKYRVRPKLVNRNAGKYKTVKALWDTRLDRWAGDVEKRPSLVWRDRKVLDEKLEYDIVSVEKL